MDIERPPWQRRAACRGRSPAEFFPPDLDRVGGHRVWDSSAATEFCDACPVAYECLSDALDRGEKEGVWGGVNVGRERRRDAARRAS